MHPDPLDPAALLAEMAQLAAAIARAWAPVAQLQARQAEQGSLDPQARDASKIFNSVTSGLRHTLALRETLLKPARQPTRDRYTDLRQQVSAELKNTIRDKAHPGERENLLSDMHERLDSETFATELAHLPLNDIVAILAIRLGLPPTLCKASDSALVFDLNLPDPLTHPAEYDEALAAYVSRAEQSNPESNDNPPAPAAAGGAIPDQPKPPPPDSS